jgi:hypothetical protein
MIKRILLTEETAQNMLKLSSFLCINKKGMWGLVKIIGAGTKFIQLKTNLTKLRHSLHVCSLVYTF